VSIGQWLGTEVSGEPRVTWRLSVLSLCPPVRSSNPSITTVKQAVYSFRFRRYVERHLQVYSTLRRLNPPPGDGTVRKLRLEVKAWRTVVSLSVIRHDVMTLHVGVAPLVVYLDSLKVLYQFLLNVWVVWGIHVTFRFLAVLPSSGKLVCHSDRSLLYLF
jgi:hypothetical protein